MRKICNYLILLMFLTGCQNRDEKSVQFLEQLATVAYNNRNDCDAMGDALEKFVAERREQLEIAKSVDKTGDQAARDAFHQKYGKRVTGAGEKLMSSLFKCSKNKKVMEVVKLIN